MLARKIVVIALLVLNVVVLLGQIWPEGAPPFARIVNIVFLVSISLYLAFELGKLISRKPGDQAKNK